MPDDPLSGLLAGYVQGEEMKRQKAIDAAAEAIRRQNLTLESRRLDIEEAANRERAQEAWAGYEIDFSKIMEEYDKYDRTEKTRVLLEGIRQAGMNQRAGLADAAKTRALRAHFITEMQKLGWDQASAREQADIYAPEPE